MAPRNSCQRDSRPPNTPTISLPLFPSLDPPPQGLWLLAPPTVSPLVPLLEAIKVLKPLVLQVGGQRRDRQAAAQGAQPQKARKVEVVSYINDHGAPQALEESAKPQQLTARSQERPPCAPVTQQHNLLKACPQRHGHSPSKPHAPTLRSRAASCAAAGAPPPDTVVKPPDSLVFFRPCKQNPAQHGVQCNVNCMLSNQGTFCRARKRSIVHLHI